MKPVRVLVQTVSGTPMALVAVEGFVASAGFHVAEYVPAPERQLAALRRLVAYGRHSATEALHRAHSDETKREHRGIFMGRSDGFQAMTDALAELVELMEHSAPGIIPLKPLPEPK